MKVLIVCSGNFSEPEKNFPLYQAFIYDQMVALQNNYNIQFEIFLIKSKGFRGYLSHLQKLKRKLQVEKFDLIHAHFSLSGLVSVLASSVPVVITFHGSDINNKLLNLFSSLAGRLAKHNIFVSTQLYQKIFIMPQKHSIIPCGVDTYIFKPQPATELKKKWNLNLNKKYILFSSSFTNPVKNYSLAKEALALINNFEFELIELTGYNRFEVSELMAIADVALMTSFSEGSPQFVKEAMACNLPIVSTDVGDVRQVVGNTAGCYITSFEPGDVAEKIKKAFEFGKKTNGRENIKHLDNKIIAEKIIRVYQQVING